MVQDRKEGLALLQWTAEERQQMARVPAAPLLPGEHSLQCLSERWPVHVHRAPQFWGLGGSVPRRTPLSLFLALQEGRYIGTPHGIIYALPYCVFAGICKLKVCDNPASGKPFGTIFPTAFAPFLSLCHILIILRIYLTFSSGFYLLG